MSIFAKEIQRMRRLGYRQISTTDLTPPFACVNCGCLVAQKYAEKHRKHCFPPEDDDE
jgi:hypothetical protein